MELLKRMVLLLAPLAAVPAVAAEDAGTGAVPPEKFVYCTVCHGADVKGNPQIAAPRLSGMSEWYAKRQLDAFKKGWRGSHEEDLVGMEMRPMAAILSDAEIAAAAEYVHAAESPPPPATIEGDVERGKTLFASCSVCHGNAGEGNEAVGGPALTVQNDWYLFRQLVNFKTGVRGSAPGDIYGMQMRAAAQVLPDEDAIRDIVSYLNTLRTEKGP